VWSKSLIDVPSMALSYQSLIRGRARRAQVSSPFSVILTSRERRSLPSGAIEICPFLSILLITPERFCLLTRRYCANSLMLIPFFALGRDKAPKTAHCWVVNPSFSTAFVPVLCNIFAH